MPIAGQRDGASYRTLTIPGDFVHERVVLETGVGEMVVLKDQMVGGMKAKGAYVPGKPSGHLLQREALKYLREKCATNAA